MAHCCGHFDMDMVAAGSIPALVAVCSVEDSFGFDSSHSHTNLRVGELGVLYANRCSTINI